MNEAPKHIAIIMDGSGRWAQRRMLPRIRGHHQGVESARTAVKHCVDLKIPILTLFAFSSENWQRPPTEVKLLMSILQNLLLNEVHELHANNVKLRVIGNVEALAASLRKAIISAENLTINNTGLQLNIALNYGGRWDITQAARKLCQAVMDQKIAIDQINEELFSQYVALSDLAPPDLLIRTSGEQRISNFLLWQLAYTEFYFCETLWPDFTAEDLDLALKFYAQRQRRFGGICLDYVS